jgi:hypothetical protein
MAVAGQPQSTPLQFSVAHSVDDALPEKALGETGMVNNAVPTTKTTTPTRAIRSNLPLLLQIVTFEPFAK